MSQPTRKLGHKVSSLSIQSQQTTVFVESHEAGYVTRPYRFLVQVWRRNRDCRRGVSAPPRRTGVSISFQIGENVNTKMFRRIRISDLPIMISSHLFDPTIGKIIQNGVDQILTKLKVYFKKNLYQQHGVRKQAVVVWNNLNMRIKREEEREEDTQIIATQVSWKQKASGLPYTIVSDAIIDNMITCL